MLGYPNTTKTETGELLERNAKRRGRRIGLPQHENEKFPRSVTVQEVLQVAKIRESESAKERRNIPTSISCFVRMRKQSVAV